MRFVMNLSFWRRLKVNVRRGSYPPWFSQLRGVGLSSPQKWLYVVMVVIFEIGSAICDGAPRIYTGALFLISINTSEEKRYPSSWDRIHWQSDQSILVGLVRCGILERWLDRLLVVYWAIQQQVGVGHFTSVSHATRFLLSLLLRHERIMVQVGEIES